MVKKDALQTLRSLLTDFRDRREHGKSLIEEMKRLQPELITALQEAGVDNERGVIFDPDDKSKGVGYVQQNEGSEVWDTEAIHEYLKKRKSLWLKSSSRVFDPNKWEALIASKEISPKVANKFKKKMPPAEPFIRFGKIKDNSL